MLKLVDAIDYYLDYDMARDEGACRHYINQKTGELLCWKNTMYFGDELADEAKEVDRRIEAEEHWLDFPSKYELDLGRSVPLAFARKHLKDEDYDLIRGFFSRSGAYRNFRAYIARIDVEDKWYRYEENAIKEAIKNWLDEHGIEYTE